MQRTQVFVSYSHADRDYLDRLKIHLRPFERSGRIDLWSDSKIEAGEDWRKEIRAALDAAVIAVVLVSADFLASDFIAENELPPLLAACEADGVVIIPVILKPCSYKDIPNLTRYQSVNPLNRPLVAMSEAEREELWVEVVSAIRKKLPVVDESTANFPLPEASDRPRTSLGWGADSLLGEELARPNVIANYFVYSYQHLDALDFMPPAVNVLPPGRSRDQILSQLRLRLRKAGWEGDGEIQVLWLPPFLGAGVEDTYGLCVWHVKQDNNGTSWLASPVPLSFDRLLNQN
jgi:TIR domain